MGRVRLHELGAEEADRSGQVGYLVASRTIVVASSTTRVAKARQVPKGEGLGGQEVREDVQDGRSDHWCGSGVYRRGCVGCGVSCGRGFKDVRARAVLLLPQTLRLPWTEKG